MPVSEAAAAADVPSGRTSVTPLSPTR
jgi:hypothetical protein